MEDMDKMQVYDKDKKIIKTVCNQCGYTQENAGGVLKKDFFHGEKTWGYFSNQDGRQDCFDLCEECYQKLTESFAVKMEK